MFNQTCRRVYFKAAVGSSVSLGNQLSLGGGAMGVTTSEPTNLHTDSLSNTLNTNKSVSASVRITMLHISVLFLRACTLPCWLKEVTYLWLLINFYFVLFSYVLPPVSCCQTALPWARWEACPQQHPSLLQAPGSPGTSTSLRTCAITSYTNCKCKRLHSTGAEK